jgi:hypothetical protein
MHEKVHFTQKVSCGWNHYQRGDVDSLSVADARNLTIGGYAHTEAACPGAPACAAAVALEELLALWPTPAAEPLQEKPHVDPVPARSDDARRRRPDGDTRPPEADSLVCPAAATAGCNGGKPFSSEAGLKTHRAKHKH